MTDLDVDPGATRTNESPNRSRPKSWQVTFAEALCSPTNDT